MPGVPPARYAYLGPEGTFTEAAVRRLPAADRAQLEPVGSVDAALDSLRSGEVDGAVVPIENSVEGGVTATLDALASGEPLVITREVTVPVTFVLAARPGTALADVRRVSTHPHGWAQVRAWVHAHVPHASYVPALSTAAAAAGLVALGDAERPGDWPPYDAAVCAPIAASRYGLDVLARDIGDNAGAVTRFVLVSRPAPLPPPTGADKTTVVVYQRDDHPGGLLELLEQFAVRGINLTRIESRPTGESLGRYCFSIDFEGHAAEERVGEALMGLHRTCPQVRFLGSYPRADGQPVEVGTGTTDRSFRDARAWIARLRDGTH